MMMDVHGYQCDGLSRTRVPVEPRARRRLFERRRGSCDDNFAPICDYMRVRTKTMRVRGSAVDPSLPPSQGPSTAAAEYPLSIRTSIG